MIVKIGLTGSIGMGKTTTARMFADEGCFVWNADDVVHRLYAGPASDQIENLFPGTTENGQVDRDKLRVRVAGDPDALKKLENIIHPLVAQDRMEFIKQHDTGILVFDIPLLFETGADQLMDVTVCVSIDPKTQKKRVMDRGTMTEQQFETILSKQMPDAEKRALATYVIETSSIEYAQKQVKDILKKVAKNA